MLFDVGVGVAGLLIGVIGLLLLEVPPDMLSQVSSRQSTSFETTLGQLP
jgi:hypothetical protein